MTEETGQWHWWENVYKCMQEDGQENLGCWDNLSVMPVCDIIATTKSEVMLSLQNDPDGFTENSKVKS